MLTGGDIFERRNEEHQQKKGSGSFTGGKDVAAAFKAPRGNAVVHTTSAAVAENITALI